MLFMRPALLVVLSFGLACIAPSDQRPGLWLRGESAELPADWSFTDAHREISLQVTAPWRLAHSVTIWCAGAGDALYVAASRPDQKRWPGWVRARPDVVLRIGERLFEARLVELDDPGEVERVRAAYAAKYERASRPGQRVVRYWRVEKRD